MKTLKMIRQIAVAVTAFAATASFAQSGTNSPYSQYGLGQLADQSSGVSRGMNGLGYALREHNQVNPLNPASYSAMDSLSFIFDAGVSLQLTNFEENGKKLNAKNANFEYVVAAFRVAKNLGVSFGLQPYTNVGYSYSSTARINSSVSPSSPNATYTNTYSGDGGLHQVYLGAGWQPLKGLSLGFNASYVWGDYNRVVVNSYSDEMVNTLSKSYSADVSSYKIDLGLQYTARLSKNNRVTLGLTYGIGRQLGTDPECVIYSTNSKTGVSDTTRLVAEDGLRIPTVLGAGLLWNHRDQLKLGVDYQLQKWAEIDFPQYGNRNNRPVYELVSGLFSDRHKVTFGGEYCKGERHRSFLGRMHYRAGVSYATPYLKINGQDGPKELSVSAGLGIPIINNYNNRSMLNISGQWVRQTAPGLINENTFRLNVGFTFNERWFAKFKVD